MTLGSRLRPILLAAGLVLPMAAHAQITPDQSQQLERQIRAWLAGLLGPNVPLSDHPIRVTPEADHYRLSIEFAGQYGDNFSVTGDPITMLVKPIDGSRWAVDELRMPSPLRVDNKGPGDEHFKSYALKIAEQNTHGVIDLSVATTSSLDSMLRGYSSTMETAKGAQTSHLDRYTSHTVWQPAGAGLLNALIDGHADNFSTSSTMPDGTPVLVSASLFDVTGHIDKVSTDQVTALIKATTDLIPIAMDAAHNPQTPHSDGIPEAARGPVRAMLVALRDTIGGMEEQYSAQGIKVDAGGHTGSLAKFTAGLGFGAPDGRIDVHMLLAMDGLESAEIPPGVFRDYVPRHVSLRPRISGIPSADVMQFLMHAIDSDGQNGDELTAEALGLLAKGPLSMGIDDLTLEAGPAALKGSGSIEVSSPADYSGQAIFRVTGFDKLIQQASTTPELKQAGPVLIFLKGIGKQEGQAVVWNITYQDKKLLVNGTDLSSMVPGGGN